MKVGDKIPVSIDGHTINHAEVKEIDTTTDPWTVRLVTPATITIMAMRTQLAPEIETAAPEAVEGADHVLLTDRVEQVGEGVPVTPEVAATEQVPGLTGSPVDTAPTTVPGTPVADAVGIPTVVENAVEEKATE